MKVEGDKLYLKEIVTDDITDSVMTWFDDKELMKFYTNSKKKITKEGLLNSIREGKEKGNLFTFGMFYKENDVLIGTIKLGPIHQLHKTSDLVALIGNREYHGRRLSVEAIELGNRLAFEKFDIRKLFGGMYESNIASIKAYTRAGWIIEGRLKNQFVVDGIQEDRILVGCFNQKYITDEEVTELKNREKLFYERK